MSPDLLEGEIMISQAEKVLRLQAYDSTGISGNLYCTNFRISFVTMSSNDINVSIYLLCLMILIYSMRCHTNAVFLLTDLKVNDYLYVVTADYMYLT